MTQYRCLMGLMAGYLMFAVGCGKSQSNVIRMDGSDTMVNLAQAWAEDYMKLHPEVSIQVNGGGSGVGISKLINGTTDIANASRDMKEKEKEAASAQAAGKDVKEHTVALDALAVYVHKENPLDSIAINDLAEIYGENGQITNWSQVPGWVGEGDEIVRVSRQNNSGTYAYFREAVLGKEREFKLGSIDQSGSKDVVELVTRTPAAIGYSGMGYATPEVKMLSVSKDGESPVAPTAENASSGAYPLARPLHLYMLGEPTGPVKDFIDWIHSSEGQAVVEKIGYVAIGS